MFTKKEEIEQWLNHMGIHTKNYTINDDLTVNAKGLINISNDSLEYIPVQFREIHGNFACSNNKLKSLKGVPTFVGGDFLCEENPLSNYDYFPQYVQGSITCSEKITLHELLNMKFEQRFFHICQPHERIEIFSHYYEAYELYDKNGVDEVSTYCININLNKFNAALAPIREKQVLEDIMKIHNKDSFKIKI
jgi:hypothetical protein